MAERKRALRRGLCTTFVLDCVEVVTAWYVGYYVRLRHRFLLFFFKKKQVDDDSQRFRRSINFVIDNLSFYRLMFASATF
jgi:hypothetical protein